MRQVGLVLAVVAAAVFAAETQAETAQRGGTLTYSLASDPPNLDCHAGSTFAVIQAVGPHYSTLLKFDLARYPAVVGDLAETWEASPDQKTFTFRLLPASFHDGSPLTSVDVKATYDRLRQPPAGVVSVRKASFDAIESIETPDARTVIFKLSRIDAAMLANFASPWNCIYSAAKLAQDPNFPVRNVLGSGPFRLTEYVPGSHWVGQRNDKYFRPERPYLDGFRALIMPNSATVINALVSRQILADFRTITPSERDRLQKDAAGYIRIEESVWSNHILLTFNTSKPPFDDARVRRALNMAIDRWTASEAFARTATIRMPGGVMRPGSPFGAPEAELVKLPGFSRDMRAARNEARRLLREAGHPNLTLALTTRTIQMPYTPSAVFVIDQWRQIGVTADNRPLETGPWTAALANGGFDAIFDFSAEFMDEPNFGLLKYISFDRSPTNASRAIDRQLDALFDQQARTTDLTERNRVLRQFEQRLFEQSYTVPFLWQHRIVATNTAVRGWVMSSSHVLGQDLADVWISK